MGVENTLYTARIGLFNNMTGNIKYKPLKSYMSKCNEKNSYANIFIVTVLLLALGITPVIFSGIINSKSDSLNTFFIKDN